jgi:hypothetical protein
MVCAATPEALTEALRAYQAIYKCPENCLRNESRAVLRRNSPQIPKEFPTSWLRIVRLPCCAPQWSHEGELEEYEQANEVPEGGAR